MLHGAFSMLINICSLIAVKIETNEVNAVLLPPSFSNYPTIIEQHYLFYSLAAGMEYTGDQII